MVDLETIRRQAILDETISQLKKEMGHIVLTYQVDELDRPRLLANLQRIDELLTERAKYPRRTEARIVTALHFLKIDSSLLIRPIELA